MKYERTKLLGLACAVVALGVAFWMWPDGHTNGSETAAGKPDPVTKANPRERDRRSPRTKNPREEFVAARERGLMDAEVKQIVDEYLQSGIGTIDRDDPTGQKLFDRRSRQQKWYIEILAEGLGLSNVQRAEAEAKLGLALKSDFIAYQEVLHSDENITIHNDEGAYPPDQFPPWMHPAERMFSPSSWIGSEELRPWAICNLDEAQKDILRYKGEDGLLAWLPWGMSTHDFAAEKPYEDLSTPIGGRTSITYPSGFLFPLSIQQVDHIRAACISGWDLETGKLSNTLVLDQVKFLTPAQLKSLLLFTPNLADHLIGEMEGGLGE